MKVASFDGGEDPFASGGTSIWGEASLRGFLSRTKDVAGAGEGAGAPLLRRGEHMGLPCPKSIEGAGPRGLKAPKEAETWAFPSPGPKGKAQAKPEWAMVSLRRPVTTSQAWEGGPAAPVMSEVGA